MQEILILCCERKLVSMTQLAHSRKHLEVAYAPGHSMGYATQDITKAQ